MVTLREKANAIRALTMDAVEKAQSGHPGMPMGLADVAEVLWSEFLNHNPDDPNWPDRDRFILSNGHGSMLQYALLHLTGYDLTIDDIKQFRQLHSRTPGHPELGYTPGVETTTGPLGQGLANGVGMALAEKRLANEFNREALPIVDHWTYVVVGDGDLMEGISHEASALAGTLALGKLIVLWDNNSISIDGDVSGWFTEDVMRRYQAYNWQVIGDVDASDSEAVYEALQQARADTQRPTLVSFKSVIGYGAPSKAGTKEAHGSPLGESEIAQARKQLNWSHEPFVIPQTIYDAWDHHEQGRKLQQQWQNLFDEYAERYPQLAAEFKRRLKGELPHNWSSYMNTQLERFAQSEKALATRKSSQQCLNSIAAQLPELSGGSADLTGSNCTQWDEAVTLTADNPAGDYIYYGVREFAMFAVMNGQSLHGGLIPFGGTFLTFIDYGRNALRLAALMQIRSIFVLTHDSIGLGEDGPTHQPLEHAAILRATPNVSVWRPADQAETFVAWQKALERHNGPTCLLLSRQKVQQQKRDDQQVQAISSGGYILMRESGQLHAIVIATGSEVDLAMAAAHKAYEQAGLHVRVVSMPSMDTFLAQSQDYQSEVLPPETTARVVIEAASPQSWWPIAGPQGIIMGMEQYGESAPYQDVYNYYGFTVENAVNKIYAVTKATMKE